MNLFKGGSNHGKRTQWLFLGGLCLFYVLLNIASLSLPLKASLTYDENYYYESGIAILSGEPSKRGETNIDERNIMPANALNPLFSEIVRSPFSKSIKKSQALFLGKLGTIFVSLVLAIYIFFWSHKLYGVNAGFLALSLYILDPNILAHSGVVHQDIFGACGVFVAVYYFWNFLRFGGRKNAILSAIAFGVSQITRYTAIYLVPIYLILAFGFYGSTILNQIKARNFKLILLGVRRSLTYTILLALTTILIVNSGFSFDRTFTKFGDYKFASRAFTSLQSSSSLLRELPVPFPYAYLRGLDMGKYKQETAFGNHPAYLMGKLGLENGEKKGFKEYFIIAFLYKVPIATQLILFMSVVSLFRFRKSFFWQNEAFLIIPSIFFLIALSFSNAQIGIRYILMIFPFLFVLSGQAANFWTTWPTQYRILIVSLVSYLLISNLSYFPHYLSYFNELLLDRKMSYAILADSNLDWGQNQNYLQQYLEKNSNSVYMAYERVDGILDGSERLKLIDSKGEVDLQGLRADLVVVTANQLVGITTDPKHFQWLRETQKPVDHISYSYLVFKVKPQNMPRLLKPGEKIKV